MEDINKLLQEVKLLNNNKEYDKVIEILTNDTLDYYKNANLYLESAKALGNKEKFDECKIVVQKALEIDYKNAKVYCYLGNIYYNKKKYKEAKEYYEKAIVIESNLPDPYNGLGNVYKSIKDYKKAIEYYEKSMKIDSKYVIPYNNIGIVYRILKDYDMAEEYYLKAIELDSSYSSPFNGLGNVYYDIGDYENAKNNYIKYLELKKENTEDFFYKRALSQINEINKIQENSTYKKVSNIIDKIKELLKFKGESVSHYTGISTVQFLVFKESPLRLSEGSFLNDTSEGQELFSFLEYLSGENVKKSNKESFTRRPYIGSFVDADKNNDLTLWRMYGKEKLEEAKGCSITLNVKDLASKIKDKICPEKDFNPSSFDDIEFYRVAYRNKSDFEFAGATLKQNKELSQLMKELFKLIEEFKNDENKQKNDEKVVIELLNQIAYLFKSTEYKYENEIRLIIKDGIGFEKKIDFDKEKFEVSNTPLKVYIELVPIHNILDKITIGPKVDKAEEWASTFYYQLANNDLFPEIEKSTLPFK